MADLITREATAEEARPVVRFISLVKSKRDLISRALSAAKAASDCQNWCVNNGIGYTGPLFGAEDSLKVQLLAARATKLEAYAAGLESQKLFFRPNATNTDINIMAATMGEATPEAWAGISLGILPLIIIVAGVVLLAAAIAVAIGFYTSAAEEETLYKKRVIELDKWAAGQDASTRSAWEKFKGQNKAENAGFWEGLTGGLKGILAILLVGLGAWAISKLPARKSEAA